MLLNIHIAVATNENVTNQFDVRYEFISNLSNSNIVLQTCFTNDEMVDIDNYFHNLSSSTFDGNYLNDTTTSPTITTINNNTFSNTSITTATDNQTSKSYTSLLNQYHSTRSISNNTPIQYSVSNKISKEVKKRTFHIPSVESSPQPSSSIWSTRLSMKHLPSLKKKRMKSTMRGHTSSQSFSKESPWQFHTYSEGKRQDCDNLVFFHFKPNQ